MEAISGKASQAMSAGTWIGFCAMCLGMFMAVLDIQVVATSLPEIQGALAIEREQMSWVQTTYLIAEVVAISLTAFLTRVLSMRGLFVAAIAIFTLASAGCAASFGFSSLIAWRAVQGFAGGALIPLVFSAVFLLFPFRAQGVATTIAGVLAVLAPTCGPLVGGWITQTFSWHWLFLINIGPGVASALLAWFCLPRERTNLAWARGLDQISLVAIVISLACLELALKEAPQRGWITAIPTGLLAIFVLSSVFFVRRILQRPRPFVDLRALYDRNFAVGCALSFILGVGLFGSVYLIPVFLAFVRGLGPLAIGWILLATGAAQLLTAPVAVEIERRFDPRPLAFLGFALFAVGLGASADATNLTGGAEMFWPQVVRGCAIMFCLLPPTRLALGHLELSRVSDASALFNLMRNIGGAIGIALIDTVIYGRGPIVAEKLTSKIMAGDMDAAHAIGVSADLLRQALVDERARNTIHTLIERQSLVESSNEAWMMLAIITATSLLFVPFFVPHKRATTQ